MPLVPTQELLNESVAARRPLFAFNIITLEHAEAVVDGADAANSCVVLQVSENAVRYHGGRLRPLTAAAQELAHGARVRVSLHLDHVTSVSLLHQAVDAGYSSVMFDAAKLPYEANVRATAEAAEWAHERGLLIEAELGEIGGKQGAHAPGVRTDPAEAAAFVKVTAVDALAVAVGNTHAMTKRDASLDTALIAALQRAVPVPLVLHGSSGVSDVEIRKAVRNGITKVNVGTLLNRRFSAALRKGLCGSEIVDPRPALNEARQSVASAVTHLLVASTQSEES